MLIPRAPQGDFTKEQKLAWIKEHRSELRHIMQVYGSEYTRARDPFFWVKLLHNQLVTDKPTVALITDLRFPNEALYVKVNKGYTIEVKREGFVDLSADGHESEHALVGYPFDICLSVPEGEVEQLKRESVEVFDLICKWITPTTVEDDFDQTA